MRQLNQDTITQAVLARLAHTPDTRLKELMTSLVQHLHAFARETRLTEAEWRHGLEFLTNTGQQSQGQRQEFALLSDVLGLSTLTVAMNNGKPAGCTEAAVLPALPGLASDQDGPACQLRGQVRDLQGQAIGGAEISVSPGRGAEWVHALSGSQGEFSLDAALAEARALPTDGPVGQFLAATACPAWRPAHVRVTVRARGYEALHTEIFAEGDPYLEGDAAFGVRPALVAYWQAQADGSLALNYDFILNKAMA